MGRVPNLDAKEGRYSVSEMCMLAKSSKKRVFFTIDLEVFRRQFGVEKMRFFRI